MSLFKRLFNAVKSGTLTQADWDEIRSNLIDSDLGVKLVDEVIAIAKASKPDDAQRAISDEIRSWLSAKSREIAAPSDGLTPILLVGVNGVGKTTTCAKIANLLQKNNYSVKLAAADTFRAAAVEQLQSWGQRLNIEVVSGKANSDPASVVFEATTSAIAAKCDYLIVDTAGRLHTKQGLMDELVMYQAPSLLGQGKSFVADFGANSIEQKMVLDHISSEVIDGDVKSIFAVRGEK
jgi:fused signal recognition particle receptor